MQLGFGETIKLYGIFLSHKLRFFCFINLFLVQFILLFLLLFFFLQFARLLFICIRLKNLYSHFNQRVFFCYLKVIEVIKVVQNCCHCYTVLFEENQRQVNFRENSQCFFYTFEALSKTVLRKHFSKNECEKMIVI